MNTYSTKSLYPLSHPQSRIWYVESIMPEASVLVNTISSETRQQIDFELLEQAVHSFVRQQDALRLRLTIHQGEIRQYVGETEAAVIERYELGSGPESQARFQALVRRTEPFQSGIYDCDLYTIIFYELEGSRGFIAKFHHLISDGWSVAMFIDYMWNYCKHHSEYSASSSPQLEFPFPAGSYLQYLEREQAYKLSPRFQKSEAYWLEKFDTMPDLIAPSVASGPAASRRSMHILTERQDQAIRSYVAEHHLSYHSFFMAVLYMYLSHTHQSDDFVIGMPVFNRSGREEKQCFGMFASTLALRIQSGAAQKADELARYVHEEMKRGFFHQKYPFDLLMYALQSKHHAVDRLYSCMVNYLNYQMNSELNGVPIVTNWHDAGYQSEMLQVTVGERYEQRLIVMYDYLTELFTEDEIELMHQRIMNLCSQITERPGIALGELEWFAEGEKERIVNEFNDTEAEYPREQTMHGLFEEQAARTPEREAVRLDDKALTYRELNERANRLAWTLRSEGVGPGRYVGIIAERSLEMMVGIYAILKAGGAYVPIDPAYPQERIAYMLEDSGAAVLLAQRPPEAGFQGKLILLSDDSAYADNGANLEPAAGPRDVAYVIYTSGSTGKPKGVMVEHRSAINRIVWMQHQYPLGADDTILQKTAFTFDVSVWELFWWGWVGAKLCLLAPGEEKNPQRILEAIAIHRVTTLHFVPPMLHAFLEYAEQQAKDAVHAKLASLRQVFASGEALPPQHVARFQRTAAAHHGARLINLYGPTEAAIDVTYFNCEPDGRYEAVPIGKPVWNTQLYIFKENTTQLQPIGVAGELCIAGVQVARGYLNRPDLTAEKFVPNPFRPEERMYRTGDLARWLPDGNIEYIGRIDHQVKIRGYRIELGELEAQLLLASGVKEAVVTAREDGDGQKQLAAYYTADRELPARLLRAELSAALPAYMVPAYLIQLERMPLNANGKVDRKALPKPEACLQPSDDYKAPSSGMELRLATIWQEVLGLQQVGVKDDFFESGGHSLKASRLAAAICKELEVELSIREVFRYPTIEQLAAWLEGREATAYRSIPRAAVREHYPVSSAQKRMYLLSHRQGGELSYNMPGALQLDGRVDPEQIAEAFRSIIQRHEALRTAFFMEGEEVVQRAADTVSFELETARLEKSQIAAYFRQFIRPFHLEQAPLLRAALVELAPERHLLLLDIHHIVSDGVSIENLQQEFFQLLAGRDLPPLPLQYKDYAVWQRERLGSAEMQKQELYWLEQLKGTLPEINLPFAYQRPSARSFAGAQHAFEVPSETTASLRQLAAESGATPFMALLAAYTVLLAKYTGQEDIIVGTPVAGRLAAELDPLIGMFVNTLALRNFPRADLSFRAFLSRVRAHSLDAFEHQEYPLDELIEKLGITWSPSRNPLFDTLFVFSAAGPAQPTVGSLAATPYVHEEFRISKLDLSLYMELNGERLHGTIEYSSKLFHSAAMEQLADDYIHLLQSICSSPDLPLGALELPNRQQIEDCLFESIDFNFG